MKLRRVDSLSQLTSLVDMAARRRGGDGEYLHELAVWSGRHVSRAGVPARSIPQPDASSPVPARVFAGTVLAQPADSIPADENAVVIALGTGEATSLVLLTATALGLASCPVTEPLEIADARAAVRENVFGGNEFPQMLLRVGWARSTLIRYSRPRHDLSEVVEFVDGSPFH